MKARLERISRDIDTGEYLLTIRGSAELVEAWNELKETTVEATMKRWHPKRGLSANAYAWVLIDKLAARLGRSKIEVYREAIRGIGGVSDTVCVQDKAVEHLRATWENNGAGWFTETMPSKVKGCTCVVLYYGSSVYDTKQMHDLIDHIVQDCKALGIETMTPAEIAAIEDQWERR